MLIGCRALRALSPYIYTSDTKGVSVFVSSFRSASFCSS